MACTKIAQSRLLTSDELASWLGCSRTKVYELVSEGMPHFRLGQGRRAEYRFDRDGVARWLADCVNANAVEESDAGSVDDDDLFRERSICRHR